MLRVQSLGVTCLGRRCNQSQRVIWEAVDAQQQQQKKNYVKKKKSH